MNRSSSQVSRVPRSNAIAVPSERPVARAAILIGGLILALVCSLASAGSASPLPGADSVVVQHAGRLAKIDLQGNELLEDTSLAFSSGVIATFGQSTATGEILAGVYSDEGLALYMGKFQDPQSNWRLVSSSTLGSEWAPDGLQFLYITADGVLILDGVDGAKHVANGVVAASFSPDGKLIALIKTIAGPDSTNGHPFMHRPSAGSTRLGEKADESSQGGLYVYDISTHDSKLVTASVLHDFWFLGYAPAWSPDGTKIVFFGERDAGDSFPFWVASLKPLRAEPVQATARLPQPVTPLYWSPDGSRVLFGSQVLDRNDEIWTLDFSRTAEVRAELLAHGRPVAQVGRQLVVDDEDGRHTVDSVTGRISLSLEHDQISPSTLAQGVGIARPEATLAPVYSIKYCRPLVSFTETAWFGHLLGPLCGDGQYRFDCKTNPHNIPHRGTDFANVAGTRIYSGASGIVTFVAGNCIQPAKCSLTNTCNNGAGNYVEVTHTNGAITRYLHMNGPPVAKKTASVTIGSVLGYVGCTGESTGPHVHFEIKYGTSSYDPYYGSCSCTSQSLWQTSGCVR